MQLSSVVLRSNTICPLVEPENLQARGHVLLVRWNVNGLCYINKVTIFVQFLEDERVKQSLLRCVLERNISQAQR